MRIAVMGAGAVGCYYGGMLARAGHEVVLIGRPMHVEAVTRDGLLLDTHEFQERIPVKASTSAEAVRNAQLVLCCVKSTDTADAAAEMALHLSPEAIVLSLQNGVDNAERLQALLGRQVGAAVVYVATEMAGPGHVKHHGRGELVIAPSDASARLVEMFGAAGVPVDVSDNVVGALWAKLILNCAYNALSAITQLPYGRLVAGESIEDIMRDAVQECLDLAWAEGITVPGDCWDAVQKIAQTMPAQFSSTAQDLRRGKRSEIDHLNGYVLRRGRALGVPTPVNRVLFGIVKLLEERNAGTASAA
ncbi:ketopantoate reductase family protein [Aromatoleum petrolei]|uniref:2-dehydropantoate 2-reductase n=1 Tax=Aromatoleum petrolei TaxID=76116 RepID=A0ABX1MX31_9RHOO|nr:2-dehydropantoate 2-reductase [Aromatoleum petrolei]NMF90659.1 2-dehydropantoate 2-reductase [Aromatoleum petrolei]QTQ38765.1 2-dehydropantoate 2-reductase [Aromatoleum petrolei]